MLSKLILGTPGFRCIEDCLFRQTTPWVLEDLAPVDKWFIGIWSHVNVGFRKALERYFASFGSQSKKFREDWSNHLPLKFSVENVVTQVKNAPRNLRAKFLRGLSRHGTEAMFTPFVEAGIDLDEEQQRDNYLGTAAAFRNLPIFDLLVRSGANTALALRALCTYSYRLSDPIYNNLFSILLQGIGSSQFSDVLIDPLKFKYMFSDITDPLMDFVKSSFSIEFPHAPQILFNRQAFRRESLYGGRDICITHSYMYNAIQWDQPKIVELCLDSGLQASDLIGQNWDCELYEFSRLRPYNWLTLAIELGRASCVDVLIKYGANVDLPDGSGITALQLAQAHVAGEHSRRWTIAFITTMIASEDKETMAILKQASNMECVDTSEATTQITDKPPQDKTGLGLIENATQAPWTHRKLQILGKYSPTHTVHSFKNYSYTF